jgi:hypothetical protein
MAVDRATFAKTCVAAAGDGAAAAAALADLHAVGCGK